MKDPKWRLELIGLLISELTNLKAKAANLGIWKTYHQLDEASKVVGWELADIMKGMKHDKTRTNRRRIRTHSAG